MNSQQNIVKKLVPFFITVTLYFILLIPSGNPSFLAVIVKCAPIISLMYFVQSVGYFNRNHILTGLFFCCLGDAFLLFRNYSLHGMLAFMLGHLNYIRAFGFRPLRIRLGLFLFILGVITILLLYKGLVGFYVVGVPIYILIINAMVWRALARLQNPWTWIQFSICTGSILFAMSDFIIGINMFVQHIAHCQIFIMSSYYAAQLGISLSVLERRPT